MKGGWDVDFKHIPGPENKADMFTKKLMLVHCTGTLPDCVAMVDDS